MNIIDEKYLPYCSMKRVICHWTAGKYKATDLDREHYHFLIEDDGNIVVGKYSILDNVSTIDGKYAAHTRNCNTGSIGIAMCGMAGAKRVPFSCGNYPINSLQWDTMVYNVARICLFYDIHVSSKTVLGHGEVEKELRINQAGKWDPMRLPFQPELYSHQVGSKLRHDVVSSMRNQYHNNNNEIYIKCNVVIKISDKNHIFEGILSNGSTYVKLEKRLNEIIKNIYTLPKVLFGMDMYVSCRKLAEQINKSIRWDSEIKTVFIGN